MIRLKSIDNFRGLAVIAMIWLHLSDWWLSGDSRAFIYVPLLVTQYGFLVSYQFISGISRYLFYKTGGLREESSEIINKKKIKREFVVRGLFLLFQKDEILPWSSVLGNELYNLIALTRFQGTS